MTAWVLLTFLRGLRYRYPPCCALRYALDERHEPNQCYLRGVRCSRRRDEQWVPCHWFHKPHLIAGPDADPDDLRLDHMVLVSDSPAAARFLKQAQQ